jgi:hypothetical protein
VKFSSIKSFSADVGVAINIDHNGALAAGNDVVRISSTGTPFEGQDSRVVDITQTVNGYGGGPHDSDLFTITRFFDDANGDQITGSMLYLENSVILDAATGETDTYHLIELVQDSDSIGDAINITMNSSTTGDALSITTGDTMTDASGYAIFIDSEESSSTGDIVSIMSDAGYNGADDEVFRIEADGSVFIDGSNDGATALNIDRGDLVLNDGTLTMNGAQGENLMNMDGSGYFHIRHVGGQNSDVLQLEVTGAGDGIDAQVITYGLEDDASGAAIRITPSFTDDDDGGVGDTNSVWDVIAIDAFTATLADDTDETLVNTLNGISIGNLTESVGGDETIASSAINIGSGWDSAITIAGAGDGVNALTLTTGDIQVTDGDIDISGGDFNVTLDSGNSINVIHTGTEPTMRIESTSTDNDGFQGIWLQMVAVNGGDRTVIGQGIEMDSRGTALTDTTYGLQLDLTATAGATDKAIYIKATNEWDADLAFASTSPVIEIAGGGTLAFTDGTSTLMTLVDAGTTGNLTLSGDLAVNGGNITSTSALDINPTGDFSVTLAAGEAMTLGTTANTVETLDITGTSAENDLMELNFTIVDDDDQDVVSALDVNVTVINTGDGDTISGIMVQDLTGSEGTISEYGIYQRGTNWDYGIYAEDDVYIGGDMTIAGDDLIMGTNTSGMLLVADGTNFNPVAMSGVVAIDDAGATTLGTISDSLAFSYSSTDQVSITATGSQASGGVLDMDIDVNPNDQTTNGFSLDYTMVNNSFTGGARTHKAFELLVTNADGDGSFGAMDLTFEDGSIGVLNHMILIENLDTAGSDIITDGLIIQSTTEGYITDAIDVSDAEIDNALNVGPNTIIGSTGAITYSGATNWSSTGGDISIWANSEGGNLMLDAGDNSPMAGANGNDLILAAEDDVLVESTGGVNIDASGAVSIDSSASTISIGADSVNGAINIGTGGSKIITIGAGGADRINIDAGLNGLTMQADTSMDIDSGDALSLNSNGGVINIGNDSINQGINIGTKGQRALIFGGTTAASMSLDAGIGAFAVQADTTVDIDSSTALSINASAGAINIGNDAIAQAINLGTGAAARTISIGTGAAAMTVNVGSETSTSATMIDSGTGGLDLLSNGTTLNAIQIEATENGGGIQIDASTGGLDMNANGGVVGLGTDILNGAVNIATGGGKTLTLGTGTFTSMVVNSGSYDLNSTGLDIDTTGAGGINIDATGGTIKIGVNDSEDSDITIGSVSGTSATDLSAGSNGMSFTSGGSLAMSSGASGPAITMRANSSSGMIYFDGGTVDRTDDNPFMVADIDASGAVMGFAIDYDVGSSTPSTSDTGIAMAINVDGSTADDAGSLLIGLSINNSLPTGSGSDIAINIGDTGHDFDAGLTMTWDATGTGQHIGFGATQGGDAFITYLDDLYTEQGGGLFQGLNIDAETNSEIVQIETDAGGNNYVTVFAPGNINEANGDDMASATTGLVFLITEVGDEDLFGINSDGDVFAQNTTLTGADYAELMLDSSGDLKAGELVSVDTSSINAVVRSTTASDSGLMGIVSTKPGVLGNNALRSQEEAFAPIAFMGQVPVNVNDENGAVAVGDYITSSSTPGVGMRANAGDPTVAVALTPLASGTGRVQGLVSRNSGSNIQGGTSTGGMLSSGAATESTTTVTVGTTSFQGAVIIEDYIAFGKDMVGQAEIEFGDTEVEVVFETPFIDPPIITASARGESYLDMNVSYTVVEESLTGFKIRIARVLAETVMFNWHAFGGRDAQIFVSPNSSQVQRAVVVEGQVVEEVTVVEEPVAAEEVVAEEPATEVVEETATEEVVDEPVVEEVVVEEPVVEEPAAPVVEEVVEEIVVEETVEEVVEEEPVVEAVEETVVEVEAPVVEETASEEGVDEVAVAENLG